MYGRPLSQSRYVFVQQNYKPLQSAILIHSQENTKYKMIDLEIFAEQTMHFYHIFFQSTLSPKITICSSSIERGRKAEVVLV